MFKRSVLLLAMLGLLNACMNLPPSPQPDDPKYAPVLRDIPNPPPPAQGALFQPGHGLALFQDRKAARVGDVVTVILNENTRSSKSADTSVSKETETTILEPTILGGNPTSGSLSLDSSLSNESEFTGGADSNQRNSLTGNITVTVVEVLANGLLVVRGEKWLTLNQGEEFIRLSGLIRPEDISFANTVSSTQLADARITYSGTGTLNDANKMGWLARFFINPKWLF